jgi:type I restriction enzyme, S subunit
MKSLLMGNKQLSSFLDDFQSGSRPPGGVRGIDSGVPSIGGEHLNSLGGFNFESIKYVPKEFAQSMTKGKIKQDDILVVKDGATTGKVAFVDQSFPFENATINEHIFLLRVNEKIRPKYLFWYLWSQTGQSEIIKNFQGSAQGGINRSFVEGVEVPELSIDDQKVIVEKLDLVIPQIFANYKKLQKARFLLSKFRQAILSAAISGRLTEEWREKNPNLDSAQEILDQINRKQTKAKKDINYIELIEEDSLSQIPENWIYTHLGEVVSSFQYGTSQKSDYTFKGTPVLRIPNVISQEVNLDNLKYLPDEEENENLLVKEGDILIVRSNGSRDLVGKNALVRNLDGRYAFASYLIRITPVIVLPEYIMVFLNSMLAKRQLFNQSKSAAGINNINSKELASLRLPIPPLSEQKEITRRINAMLEVSSKVENQIETAIKKTEKITQAILAKEFRGDLVDTL